VTQGLLFGSLSGDGTLSAYNLKKGKLIARSDQLEDELLSIAIIKVISAAWRSPFMFVL